MDSKSAGAGGIDWRAAFVRSAAASCILDDDGRVLDANAALADLVGCGIEDLTGRLFDRLRPADDVGQPWLDRPNARGAAFLERSDGDPRDVTYAVTPMGDGRRLLVVSDVTEDACFICKIFSSREKFRSAIDDLSELICRCAPDLSITLVNREFATLNGFVPRAMIGRNLRDHLPPASIEAMQRFVAEATPAAPMTSGEEAWTFPDGGVRWVAWRRLGVFDSSGRLAAIQTVGRDTTQRRVAEDERLRLAAMVDRSPVVGLAWRVEGRFPIEYATPNARRVLGHHAVHRDGGNAGLLDLVHRDEAAALIAWLHAFPEAPAQCTTTVRLADDDRFLASHPCDGRGVGERWVTIRAWRSGPGRMEGVVLDVTEQRAATLALRERERRFGAIFNNMFGFIGLLTPDGRIVEANETALRFVGATEEEVLGRFFWDTPWWADAPNDCNRLKTAVASAAAGEFVRFETTHTSPEGRTIHVDFSLRPILDDSGSVTLIVPEGRDITHLKQIQAALMAAKREAEAANRSKTQFLAVMSHELRTPLNAILGYSEVMQAGMFGPVGNPRYQGYVEAIHGSGGHLLGIIDDILEVSRIELGVLELNEEPAALSDLVARAEQILVNRAAEAGVRLEVDVAPGLPWLVCDARRVIQMLVNLAFNGIKFSHRGGGVRIVARLAADGGGLLLSVHDTGAGIAPEDQARIWEPFGQAGSAHTRHGGGVGLGLTITKALVQAHGGTIALESEAGQGTTVTLSFPAARCRAEDVGTAV